MKLPTTKQGCVELYEHRRETDVPMTKLDMYLGGMICCTDDEFSYRKPRYDDTVIIGGYPCLCKKWIGTKYCHGGCIKSTEKTLSMPWDGDLHEMEERYDD